MTYCIERTLGHEHIRPVQMQREAFVLLRRLSIKYVQWCTELGSYFYDVDSHIFCRSRPVRPPAQY
jgi:hypothetical protein